MKFFHHGHEHGHIHSELEKMAALLNYMLEHNGQHTHEDSEDLLICENVREARVEGGQVTLVDILGYTMTIDGVIKKIDLIKNTLLIDAA